MRERERTGTVGWLDGILLMKLLSTKNRCATLLYNVRTLYILRRICTHGLDSWEREIGILYVHTCRDGGEGYSSYFSLIEYVYKKRYMYRKEGPRGGRDGLLKSGCDTGRLFLIVRRIAKGKENVLYFIRNIGGGGDSLKL